MGRNGEQVKIWQDEQMVCAQTRICPRQLDIDGFGLVALFNGISIFVGYLMPKTF